MWEPVGWGWAQSERKNACLGVEHLFDLVKIML